MKVRATEIKLGTIEDMNKEVLAAMKKKKGTNKHVIYVPNFSVLSKILSPKKLELLKAIKDNPGMGVNDLAKLLKRKREAVSRDISFLRHWHIIDTEYQDRKTITTAVPGKVVIEI
jgi:predicted transcriptional regulator